MRPFDFSLTMSAQRWAERPHGKGAPSTVETLYSDFRLWAAAGRAVSAARKTAGDARDRCRSHMIFLFVRALCDRRAADAGLPSGNYR